MSISESGSPKSIELLAPAGRMESLQAAVEAGCDAVYLGGKAFNMRMLRSAFNFSDAELAVARQYTADHGVKMYITVNNIYDEKALRHLGEYLVFLQELGADALIVQDPAVIQIHQEMGLNIPLHASVQMGVNNLETVRLLENCGIERVILSKNLSLADIRHISSHSHIGIEYFVHGDLCVSHTGQCYLSSFVFGESGNKGRCRKPCRWPFRLAASSQNEEEPARYLLAHNDLCLYDHLQELISAGVTSFKIEGRMREAAYVKFLVSTYRRGLDRLMAQAAPSEPGIAEDRQALQEQRIRDYTAGCIYGDQAADSVGMDGSREPRFFSRAVSATVLGREDYAHDNHAGQGVSGEIFQPRSVDLQVKVRDLSALKSSLAAGARQMVIDYGVCFQDFDPWSTERVLQAQEICHLQGAELILELPRLGHRFDYRLLDDVPNKLLPAGISRFIVHDPGMIHHMNKWDVRMQGGYGLNTCNSAAARFWMSQGLTAVDLSLELKMAEMDFAGACECGLIVHGPICGLITDLNLGQNLVDELGQAYPVLTDSLGRSYIHYCCDLCLFPWLPELAGRGIKYIRVVGDRYSDETLAQIIRIYEAARLDLQQGRWEQQESYERLLDLGPRPLSAAAFARIPDKDSEMV